MGKRDFVDRVDHVDPVGEYNICHLLLFKGSLCIDGLDSD